MSREHVYGPPGTGKTHYITDKIVEHVNFDGMDPQDIGVFTFSRQAASAIRERIAEATGKSQKILNVRTIHSQCNRLLESEEYKLVSPFDIKRFARKHSYPLPSSMETYGENDDWIPQRIEEPDYWRSLSKWWTCFPYQPLKDIYPFLDLPSYGAVEEFDEFCDCWQYFKNNGSNFKDGHRRIEFHDMPRLCIDDELSVNYTVQAYDEHQDVNPLLEIVSRQWMERAEIIHVCGDPFQAIHSYMGSSPELFMKFRGNPILLGTKESPEGYRHIRRLPKRIWDIGLSVLKWCPDYMPNDKPLSSVLAIDRNCQIKRTSLDRLESIGEELERSGETALILARTNAQAYRLAVRLALQGVVFKSLRGMDFGWPERVSNLVNIWFRIKVGNTLPLPLAKALVKYSKESFMPEAKKMVKESKLDVLSITALEQWIWGGFSILEPWHRAVEKLPQVQRDALKARLRRGMGVQPPDDEFVRGDLIQKGRKLALGTIHAAKGLEADNVLLFDGISNKMRKEIRSNKKAMEEEARVWYVATTRPKKRLLVLTNPRSSFPIPVK